MNRIREYRHARGWTQAALAERMSISTQRVSQIERPDASPRIPALVAAARVFGITVDELINESQLSVA